MEEIEEITILEANTMCCAIGDTNNSFGRALTQAERLKTHGLTPVYLLDNKTKILSVHAKETYGKILN